MAVFYYVWFSLLRLFICLFPGLLEYLHIERHLAAKIGTNLAVSVLVGSFLDDIFLECRVIFFIARFSNGLSSGRDD